MKICQLLLSQGDGGLEKHVIELSTRLARLGHDVTLIADHSLVQRLPDTVKKSAIPTRLGRRNPFLLAIVLFKLRRINPDIVHAQANKAASVLRILKSLISAKTVGTLHNIKRDISAFNKLDCSIAVSEQLTAQLQGQNINTIYNGIDLNPETIKAIDLTKFGVDSSKPTLFAVGRLVRAKGFDLLIKAVDGLAINLIIIGDGEQRSVLQTQIDKLHEATNCLLLGHRDDALSFIKAADAVVISSRREGFSYVLAEALLLQKNIIATDVPVANEVLPEKLIVPIADVAKLRQTISIQLANRKQWFEAMQPAFSLAQQRMTLDMMAYNTIGVYQSTLAN